MMKINLEKNLLLPEANDLLAKNQELKKGRPKDMQGVGRLQLRIPESLIPVLAKQNPELFCLDKQIKERAWRKFAQSSESLPFRVNTHKGW